MKKLIFTLVAVLMAATETFAQDVYVATLNHEGTTSTFYGSGALTQAYNASVDGDIITLSPGRFTASSLVITKAVTIRGTGMTDEVNGINETYVDYLTLSVKEKTEVTRLEGIHFGRITFKGTENFIIEKCKVDEFARYSVTNKNGVINCSYVGKPAFSDFELGELTLKNCHVDVKRVNMLTNAVLFNCYIYINTPDYSNNSMMSNNNCTNCIIYTVEPPLDSSNKVSYCLCIGNGKLDNIPERPGCEYVTTDIFNSWSEVNDSDNLSVASYELSELGLQYRGFDGTQIGMLGGDSPYNPVVSIPRITKCEVAEKATADGKLSVNIEVTAPTTK